MKSPYVSELQPNQAATATFLVQNKDTRQKKSGEPYLSLVLCDRTGEIDAKMWDNVAEVMETFDRDDFVRVKGIVQIYQNRPQFTIHKMQRVDDRDVNFGDFFPVSRRDPDEMFAEVRQIIEGMGNVHLKALLNAVMDDEEIARRFRTAPAAKTIHHAWLGGLIEHVLSVCHLCRVTAAHYSHIDLDLLLAGAILHDIGKISELTYHRSFGYSNDGQLLGHIMMSTRIIGEKLQAVPDFPPSLRTLLEHMILSHHGTLEFGSPKVPMFAEAILLHHLDNLDSKMECVRAAVQKDGHVEGCWTSYNPAMERSLLKKDRYLGRSGDAPEPPQRVEMAANAAMHSPPHPAAPAAPAAPVPGPRVPAMPAAHVPGPQIPAIPAVPNPGPHVPMAVPAAPNPNAHASAPRAPSPPQLPRPQETRHERRPERMGLLGEKLRQALNDEPGSAAPFSKEP